MHQVAVPELPLQVDFVAPTGVGLAPAGVELAPAGVEPVPAAQVGLVVAVVEG